MGVNITAFLQPLVEHVKSQVEDKVNIDNAKRTKRANNSPLFYGGITMAEYKGIDVSSWQGKPDWTKVKKSGIEFAILRIHQKDGSDAKLRCITTKAAKQMQFRLVDRNTATP